MRNQPSEHIGLATMPATDQCHDQVINALNVVDLDLEVIEQWIR
jgi:hypothetical protein